MEKIDAIIKHKTAIKAPIVDVFDCIASAEGLDKWFTKGTIFDLENKKIKFVWKDWGVDKVNNTSDGIIIEYDRPRRYVFSWWVDTYDSIIEIDFKEVDNVTIVELKESGYPDTKDGRAALMECATGWGEALTLVKFYLEYGVVY
jgi:uncharacterized protein YndB with AHSA1/START domain